MSDPAIEAARRAFDHWRFAHPKKDAEVLTEAAAREALAPIKVTLRAMGEVLDEHGKDMPTADLVALFARVITEIEKHAFTTEELQ